MIHPATEAHQEKAHQMARRGFFGACAALVAAAAAPERVYSFGAPVADEFIGFTSGTTIHFVADDTLDAFAYTARAGIWSMYGLES